MSRASILLLDFDSAGGLGRILREILEASRHFRVGLRHEPVVDHRLAFSDSELGRIISRSKPDIIFLILSASMLKQAGALFESIKGRAPTVPIIVVVEEGEPEEAFELLRLGAADFIAPPLKPTEILPRVWRLLEHMARQETLTQTLKKTLGLKQLIGESAVFLAQIKKIPLVARCDASVLILGETGTGKDLYARAIHYLSPRATKPFVPVNCGALPAELVENELFGHERGAFTGAAASQPGLIRGADGGTLFLDEVDCLPLLAQVKLLRFLQEKEYRPLGSTRTYQVDVRIIAASNSDLEEAVESGKLRRDLYYRLNIVPVVLPPLRERRADIPLLARHFLAKYGIEFNKQVTGISADAMQALLLHDWPGNVRELEYVIQRAVVLCEQTVIRSSDIILSPLQKATRHEPFQEAKARVVAQFEKSYIERLLLAYQGNITRAAQAAQKNRRAFWQLMRKHGIDAQSLKTSAR